MRMFFRRIRSALSPRTLRDDRGSVTVEAALGMATIVVALSAAVAALGTVAAYVAAVDIAGAGARSHAVGIDFIPPRGQVEVSEHAGLVTVTATVPAPLGSMSATAVFPQELSHEKFLGQQ